MADRLRFTIEFCLLEMAVKSVCSVNVMPVHHNKRDAVGKGVVFVLIVLKVMPAFMKKSLIDMDHVYGWAAKKPVADLDGLGVMSPAIEKCNDFIENIGCRDQLKWRFFYNLHPMFECNVVMLVVGKLECKQVAGINEYRCHCAVR